jgi:hypothetical protein
MAGPNGPYAKQDRAEFHHADEEAQKWFLRLDSEEVHLLRGAARLIYWGQQGAKWGQRLFWCFTGGLAAALTAGENLQKLPATISGVLSTLRGLFG